MRALKDFFAEGIVSLCKEHEEVIYLETDIESPAKGFFLKNLPDQYIQGGVAESNIVGVSAGLASEGLVPFWYTYGFLIGRTYNQIKQSVGIDRRNVKIYSYNCCVSGMGGSSHNCVEDLGLIRTIPNIAILAPADGLELLKTVEAAYKHVGPVYVRFGRDYTPDITKEEDNFTIGKPTILREGKDITAIGYGAVLANIIEAQNETSIDMEIINLSTIRPLDTKTILSSVEKTRNVLTVEEHYLNCGVGEMLSSVIGRNIHCQVRSIGVPDMFMSSGKGDLKGKYSLSTENIVKECNNMLGEEL